MVPDATTTAERLAAQPYLIRIAEDETTQGEPIFVASIEELDGCIAQGETMDEAILALRAAAVDYIASMLEDGLPVPPPSIPTTASSNASASAFPKPPEPTDRRASLPEPAPLYEFQFSID